MVDPRGSGLLFFMFISNKAPLHLFGKCELNSPARPAPAGVPAGTRRRDNVVINNRFAPLTAGA